MSQTQSRNPATHARLIIDRSGLETLDVRLHVSRYEWILDHFSVSSDECIVDLGCGSGYGPDILSKLGGVVYGVDFFGQHPVVREGLKWTFICSDVCSPDLASSTGLSDAKLVVSMEVIEHLEDYFAFLANAAALMAQDGVFILSTPNRLMTYARYPNRSHMDPSHVQEFTPTSLAQTLSHYFEQIEILFQSVPQYWNRKHLGNARSAKMESLRALIRDIVPTRIRIGVRSTLKRILNYVSPVSRNYTVEFLPMDDPTLDVEGAFALIAVCRKPRREHMVDRHRRT